MHDGDRGRRLARIVRAAAGYAAVVFAAGFCFGVVRTLFVAPVVGARAAELLEMLPMLAIVVLVARWRVGRSGLTGAGPRLAMGVAAVLMLLALELVLVMAVGDQSARAWLLDRDPVLAAVWWTAMLLMAIAPRIAGGGAAGSRGVA